MAEGRTLGSTLKDIEQAIKECLTAKDIPFCSMVWFGDNPPTTCENGLAIAIFGDIDNKTTECNTYTFYNINIKVSICAPDPATMEESTEDACSYYSKLEEVYNSLIVWWTKQDRHCSMIRPDGFTPDGESNGTCTDYYSSWLMQIN